jgi:amino acid adenylation domain-containing protein
LDPNWPEGRQAQLIEDSGATLLITKRPFRSETAVAPIIVHLDDSDCCALLADQPESNPDRKPQASDLAYILYTSGSTGTPKGVLIEHRSILRLVKATWPVPIQPDDFFLQLSPLGFDAATFEIWGPLLNGARLVLAPPTTPTLAEIASSVERHRITVLWLTSALFEAMVEEQLAALAGVRTILSGGDVLSPPHVQRMLDAMAPGQTLINGYGPTENTTFTCCHAMAGGTQVDRLGVPIGRPIANTSVYVVDGDQGLCPVGVPGELWIGGAGVARGYLNREELTAERFVPDPYGEDPAGKLYRSGDVVSWREDGTLAFHGRLDEQIKLRGFRIEPGEVEAALNAQPGIGRSLVVYGQSGSGEKQLVGYWVAEAGRERSGPAVEWSAGQLRRALGERLPEYMVPSVYVRLEAFPLTANGKIDRRALPEPLLGEGGAEEGPRTELEEELRGLWEEVLGREAIGRHDNFFEVGGHSLAAARLAGRIEQQFGVALPIAAFFQAQTVAELAELLGRSDAGAEDSCALVPLKPDGTELPLYVIHGYRGNVFCYVELARHLSPGRPVYGLQAIGIDGLRPRQSSVEEMAATYAEEILAHQPEGPYHLLGQSAGGWYAHAVASALIERGGTIGMLAILDSGPTACIQPTLRSSLLLRKAMRQLPFYLHQLLRTGPRFYTRFLAQRLASLDAEFKDFRRPAGGQGDYFTQLHSAYCPQPLPVAVQLFSTPYDAPLKQRLWRAFACGGVSAEILFERHHHFHHDEFAPELAAAITKALVSIESKSG